jgi:hypothetical protein
MPITVGRTLSNTTRDFLGTFRRELSAFSRPAVAARIEDLRTTAYGFTNAFMGPKERATGIEPTTYSLGR